ncbi:MAG TPA: efflux RND transporter periplasmic adaptor subunit [Roseiflexaceae bacterium]|nr:efflux RND transporter periplasmic adaptor subunit [Roseiflexaceae bacterium]
MTRRWIQGAVASVVAAGLVACSSGGNQANAPTAQPAAQQAATQPTHGPVTSPQNATSTLSSTLGLSNTADTTTAQLLGGISGIGEITAIQDSDLVFQVQGIVAEVKVKEGDNVKKGDVLASLDTSTFDQQVQQAEAGLQSAKAQASALEEPPRAADLAAARAQIQSAQAALSQTQAGPKEEDVRSAQASVDAAQANLQSTRDKLSLSKTQAQGQVDQATQALTQAQAKYAQAKSNWQYVQDTGNDPVQPNTVNVATGKKSGNKLSEGGRENYYTQFVQAEAALRQAEQNVDQAVKAADTARQNEVTGVQAAEQQVVQAQQSLQKLTLPPDKDKVAQARAGVAQAQAQLAKLNPAPTGSQQQQAAAAIAQAEAQVELAKINRERAVLTAPFDGVIAAVNIDPGDPSSTGTAAAIRIVDVSKLRAEVQISDTDIAKVQLGQEAKVRVDALPNKEYSGKVSYIAPAANVAGNIRTYLVRVDLDTVEGLRAGMSARVAINAE